MPSRRFFLGLALATLAGVSGVVVPALGWAALVFDLLWLAALLVDWRRARGLDLEAERRWPPLLVQEAESEIEVELRSRGTGGTVRVRDALHPALVDSAAVATLEVPAGGRRTWRYTIRPRRRGEHLAGPLMARVLGPWGLAWQQRELVAAEPRKVYPQVRWQGQVGQLLLLAHRRSLGQSPQQLVGVGTEPYALREYLPGDPPSRIHWKATARHGRPVSREDTWERGARLVILLDCARGMSAMDGRRSKLDHALAAALALTRVAASRGDRVTLAAFSNRLERSVRLHGGQRGIHTAYSAFYDVEARLAEPAFDLAVESAVELEPRRSTVVLFTSVVDLAAAELLRQAMLRLERRHRPILINLQDPELLELAHGRPETVEGAFAKIAALDIVLANRQLGSQLRRAGIRVAQAAADRLALEALETYLSLFRERGRATRVARGA